SLADEAQVAEAEQRREPTDAEMMRELGNVVELNGLGARCRAAFDIQAPGFVKNLRVHAAWLALSESRDKRAHTLLGHEEARGECVRTALDEVGALGAAADESGTIAIRDDVRVLVRKRKSSAKIVVHAIRNDEQADLAIAHGEARYVVGKIDEGRADPLRVEELLHVRQRRMSEPQPSALLVGQSLPRLDRVPARVRSRERVGSSGRQVAIDGHEPLEIRELTSERHALAQLLEHRGITGDISLGAEQGRQSVLILEGL